LPQYPEGVSETYFIDMKKHSIDQLALALDNFSSLEAIKKLIHQTAPSIGVFKIGLEQFTHFGPPVLDVVRSASRKIFLDLKFHDIPNTVAKAVVSAGALGVDYLTIHTQGGLEMMAAAKSAAQTCARPPKIIGVTLLTSIGEESLRKELTVTLDTVSYVRHLAGLACDARLDGIVCSAADLPQVKLHLPESFEIITPGIRPVGAATHDQKRIATPAEAIGNGATLLVLGRAITEAENPAHAVQLILDEISDI
jgi:orotidine-5'-phosphate decarboxylase